MPGVCNSLGSLDVVVAEQPWHPLKHRLPPTHLLLRVEWPEAGLEGLTEKGSEIEIWVKAVVVWFGW